MKASELMIGDWVRNDFGESQQIVDIRQDCVMLAYNDTFSLGKIEPIPLTPEILEKNGFYYDEDRKAYLMGVIFQVKPERYGLFSFGICGCPYPLNTVSHLQHALRLCGITLNIEV